MKIDKFNSQVEKIVEKTENLDFDFQDESTQEDFEQIKEEIISLFEQLNDMVEEETENAESDEYYE